jgi:hypothetical protein
MPWTPRCIILFAGCAIAAAALAPACQIVFGDFETANTPTDAGPTVPLTLCSAGQYRCSGAWLYACNASQDGWTQAAACDAAAHCDSANGRCAACSSGEHRCNGSSLETCNSDRTGWVIWAQCTSADECNLNSDSCRPCTPGEYQCDETRLRQCSAQQTWELVATCETAALCTVADNGLSGSCTPSVCDSPGGHTCQGSQLLRCSPGLDRLQLVENCPTAALCDAAAADAMASSGRAGTCQPAVCQPGEVRCLGSELNQLSRCNAERTGWEPIQTCENASQCNPGQAACAPCTPGEQHCNGADLRRCSPEQIWQLVDTCQTPALCNAAAGACTAPVCQPAGRVECNPGDPLELRKCAAAQDHWERLDVCVTAALCNANDRKCDPPACNAGDSRCDGIRFQICDSDRIGWETTQSCGAGEVCDLERGCSAELCSEGSLRCNDRYLEECTATGWQRRDRCATPALCSTSPSECLAPVCGQSLGEYRCLGQSLQRCSADRTAWEDFDTCPPGTQCDAANGACVAP